MNRERFTRAVFAVWLSVLTSFPPSGFSYAAEPPAAKPQFSPPWVSTRERIPREVKDLDQLEPESWCSNTESKPLGLGFIDKNELVVTYRDPKTGTRTTVKRTVWHPNWDRPPQNRDPFTEREYEWEITIENPGEPTKVVRYELGYLERNPTTGEIIKKPDEYRSVRVGDHYTESTSRVDEYLYDPDAARHKGGLLSPDISGRAFARAVPRQTTMTRAAPFLFAAASSLRPPLETKLRSETHPINIKIVTYGNPPGDTVVHFDPGPETTPESFLTTPPTTVTWDPKRDGDGPKTVPLTGGGIPVTEISRGGINIGWGWAAGRVTARTLSSCSGASDVDEILAEAHRLRQLAEQAEQGGPEFWERQARSFDAAAKRAEQELRGGAKDLALRRAKEARETAEALRSSGIPEKPDAQIKDKKRLAELERERRDAIQRLRDQAKELTARAQAMLRDASL